MISPTHSVADLLEFRAGGIVELPSEIRGEEVWLHTSDRVYEFGRDEFRKILKCPEPASEWELRWKGANQNAHSAFAAAWWAIERGLIDEGTQGIFHSHELDPSIEPAASLSELLSQLSRPLEDPSLERMRRWRGEGFRETRGRHILLFHSHSDAEATRRVAELERVVCAAYLMFGSLGLDPTPPRERFMIVWFDQEAAFESFVRHEAGSAQPKTTGYYSPARHLAATLDQRACDWYRRMKVSNQSDHQENADRDRMQHCLQLELRREAADLGTAAHELAHLIMADSGVAQPGEHPLWLLEGLATQFEVVIGSAWGGFGRVNGLRLDAGRALSAWPSLERLLRDEGFGRGYSAGPYAAAWSWVFFLRKKHPDVLLEWLASEEVATGASSGLVREPQACLLESEWIDFVQGLKSPRDRLAESNLGEKP